MRVLIKSLFLLMNPLSAFFRTSVHVKKTNKEMDMRSLIMWLLGVPIIFIIIYNLFF
jgi:hypothetical protein